jgi:F-box and WD-40 domain protein 1/11
MFVSPSQVLPVTPPPFSRGSSSRRYSRNVSRPALFQFPSTSTSGPPRAGPPSPERDFGQLLGSTLGSPFLTTTDLPDISEVDLDLVDGALSAVPRSFTVTRPTSPVPTMDFSMVSRPNSTMYDDFLGTTPSYFATPNRRGFYSGTSYGPISGSPPNALKNIFPRLWDALSPPGRKGKGKTRNGHNFDFEGYSYGDLPPLDGEEGELIDDEACLIEVLDVRAVTGIGEFRKSISVF